MSKGTTKRSIRIDDELWEIVKARAESEGLNVSDLIRQLLRGWMTMHESNAD